MMTLTELQAREGKRLAIMNTVHQAGKFGMVFDRSSYVTRPEIEALVHEGLLMRTKSSGNALYFLTEKGEAALKKAKR